MARTTETPIEGHAVDQSRRRFALHGDEVTRWFEERGWASIGRPGSGAHAFIDELVTPSLTAQRIWHTPLTLRSTLAPHTATTARRVSTWLQVDGDLSVIDSPRAELCLSAGHVYFHSRRPSTIANAHPTARIAVSLESRSLDQESSPHHLDCRSSSTWVALISIVNATLNASDLPPPPALSLVAGAIGSLTKALWFESTAHTVARPRQVLTDAMTLIERHAADPSFTVTTLAEQLGITRAHVARVFRQRGMQASRMLRDRRLRAAQSILAHDPDADLGTVAASSGFPSPRALREALRA